MVKSPDLLDPPGTFSMLPPQTGDLQPSALTTLAPKILSKEKSTEMEQGE